LIYNETHNAITHIPASTYLGDYNTNYQGEPQTLCKVMVEQNFKSKAEDPIQIYLGAAFLLEYELEYHPYA